MTTELTMLAYAVALLIALIGMQAAVTIPAVGLPKLAGNRDDLAPPMGYPGRMRRIVDNHREGLIMFAPLVLIAAVAHISNSRTVLAAELFFWGRLAHAILYAAGVPWVRTVAFGVGLIGTVMMLLAVLGVI